MQVDKDTTLGDLLIDLADKTSIETVFSEDQVLKHVRETYDLDDVFDEDVIEKFLVENWGYSVLNEIARKALIKKGF